MTWVTLVLRSTFSCFSSLVRTERTKSPGLLWLSRTKKLPALPLSVSSFSASRPDRCPWYHLERRDRVVLCTSVIAGQHFFFNLFGALDDGNSVFGLSWFHSQVLNHPLSSPTATLLRRRFFFISQWENFWLNKG